MASTKHVECHEEKYSYHVQARIAEEAFEGIFLSAAERSGRVVRIKRLLPTTLMPDGEHHVQHGLLSSRSFIIHFDEDARTQRVVPV